MYDRLQKATGKVAPVEFLYYVCLLEHIIETRSLVYKAHLEHIGHSFPLFLDIPCFIKRQKE